MGRDGVGWSKDGAPLTMRSPHDVAVVHVLAVSQSHYCCWTCRLGSGV